MLQETGVYLDVVDMSIWSKAAQIGYLNADFRGSRDCKHSCGRPASLPGAEASSQKTPSYVTSGFVTAYLH